jgi:hypothetical protein
MFREAAKQVPLATMSCPSWTAVLHSLFTTGYKRLSERGHEAFGWGRIFDGGFFD